MIHRCVSSVITTMVLTCALLNSFLTVESEAQTNPQFELVVLEQSVDSVEAVRRGELYLRGVFLSFVRERRSLANLANPQGGQLLPEGDYEITMAMSGDDESLRLSLSSVREAKKLGGQYVLDEPIGFGPSAQQGSQASIVLTNRRDGEPSAPADNYRSAFITRLRAEHQFASDSPAPEINSQITATLRVIDWTKGSIRKLNAAWEWFKLRAGSTPGNPMYDVVEANDVKLLVTPGFAKDTGSNIVMTDGDGVRMYVQDMLRRGRYARVSVRLRRQGNAIDSPYLKSVIGISMYEKNGTTPVLPRSRFPISYDSLDEHRFLLSESRKTLRGTSGTPYEIMVKNYTTPGDGNPTNPDNWLTTHAIELAHFVPAPMVELKPNPTGEVRRLYCLSPLLPQLVGAVSPDEAGSAPRRNELFIQWKCENFVAGDKLKISIVPEVGNAYEVPLNGSTEIPFDANSGNGSDGHLFVPLSSMPGATGKLQIRFQYKM